MNNNKKKAIDEEFELCKNIVEEEEMEAIAAIEDTIKQNGYDAAYEQMVKLTMLGNTKYCYLLTLLALKGRGTGKPDMTSAHFFSNLGAIGGDARCMYLLSEIYEQIMFSLDDPYQASLHQEYSSIQEYQAHKAFRDKLGELDTELEDIGAFWFVKAGMFDPDERIWREIDRVLKKIFK
ncbi:MAG: hypothetical protein IK100_11945 [Muribaculaceae bacterium]|nr:hypothetical protein [Muribaculaceae bacterium]